MKKLKDILDTVEIIELIGDANSTIDGIALNSKKCKENFLFVAIIGTEADGHHYIQNAINNKANVILCSKLPENMKDSVTFVIVEDTKTTLALIAKNYYDDPSSKLQLIGITGTNGKSTVATLSYQLFKNLGYKVGLISTIHYKVDEETFEAVNTTPNSLVLNELLAQMVDQGCAFCFMEVSSHAIHQKRIEGLQFAVGLFTNLSHDHLDYHKDFKEYLNVKKLFFDNLNNEAFAISNLDEKNGKVMLQNCMATKKYYGFKNIADYKAKIIENSFRGLQLNINGTEVHSLLIGKFNAYNLLAVYSIASILEQNELEILQGISALKNAEGRLDVYRLESENIIGLVDYAHSPDAVLNVLSTLNDIRDGNGNLISIIGCGGNRDKTKRPKMTEIASKLSNKVIITADNPRNESIDAIIEDMLNGIELPLKKKIIKINDRKEAIKTACHFASRGDVIAVLGKGHEKYQEIDGKKIPFNDKEILINALNEIAI